MPTAIFSDIIPFNAKKRQKPKILGVIKEARPVPLPLAPVAMQPNYGYTQAIDPATGETITFPLAPSRLPASVPRNLSYPTPGGSLPSSSSFGLPARANGVATEEEEEFPAFPGMPSNYPAPVAPPSFGPPPTREGINEQGLGNLLKVAAIANLIGGSFGAKVMPQILNAGAQGLAQQSEREYADKAQAYNTGMTMTQREYENRTQVRKQEVEAFEAERERIQQEWENEVQAVKERRIAKNQSEDNARQERERKDRQRRIASQVYTTITSIPSPEGQERAWRSYAADPEFLADLGIAPVYIDGEYQPVYNTNTYKAMVDAQYKGDMVELRKLAEQNKKDMQKERIKATAEQGRLNRASRASLQERRLSAQATQGHLNRANRLSLQAARESKKTSNKGLPAGARQALNQLQQLSLQKAKYIEDAEKEVDEFGNPGAPSAERIQAFDKAIKGKLDTLNIELENTDKVWRGGEDGYIDDRNNGGVSSTGGYDPPGGNRTAMKSNTPTSNAYGAGSPVTPEKFIGKNYGKMGCVRCVNDVMKKAGIPLPVQTERAAELKNALDKSKDWANVGRASKGDIVAWPSDASNSGWHVAVAIDANTAAGNQSGKTGVVRQSIPSNAVAFRYQGKKGSKAKAAAATSSIPVKSTASARAGKTPVKKTAPTPGKPAKYGRYEVYVEG